MDLEIHRDGRWHACATVEPVGPDLSIQGPVQLSYDPDYALANMEAREFRAISVRIPVRLAVNPDRPASPGSRASTPAGPCRPRPQSLGDARAWRGKPGGQPARAPGRPQPLVTAPGIHA